MQELAKRLGIPQLDEKAMLTTIENVILSNPKITSEEGIAINELINSVESQTGFKREEIHKVIEKIEEAGTLFRPKPTKIKKV